MLFYMKSFSSTFKCPFFTLHFLFLVFTVILYNRSDYFIKPLSQFFYFDYIPSPSTVTPLLCVFRKEKKSDPYSLLVNLIPAFIR